MNNKNIIAILSLFIGTGLSAIAVFATTVMIARYTSEEVFGNYSTAFAIITMISPLCGFGIAQYWLKIFGQHGHYGLLWIKKSLLFITISTISIFILLNTWFYITTESKYMFYAYFILSFILFKSVAGEIINSTLQIDGKYLMLSIWQIFQNSFVLIILLVTIFIFNSSLDEYRIALIYLSVVSTSVLMSIFILYNFIIHKKNNINYKKFLLLKKKENLFIVKLLQKSAPFGFAGLFSLIYSQLGIVFIKYLEGAESAAYYTVALTFLSAALLVPLVIYQKFLLPKLHRWAYHDKEKFEKSYYYGNYIMLGLGLLVFSILWFFAPFFINLFFGEKYHSSIYLLQIMSINIPIVYVASSAGSLLVTQSHMKTKVYYMGTAAIITLVLSIPMINYFGTIGAIYTSILSNTYILFIYFYKVKKDVLKNEEAGDIAYDR